MLILDLWGISFHAVGGFGLGKNLLFKSVLGRCDTLFRIRKWLSDRRQHADFNHLSEKSSQQPKG